MNRQILKACVLLLLSGCASTPGMVGLRPDGSPAPEPCPAKALEIMKILRLNVGDGAWINIDMNQRGDTSIILNDGPIESELEEPLGPRSNPLEGGTRL